MTRFLSTVIAICVAAALAPALALADAPDPIPNNTQGTVIRNDDGSRTVIVWGGDPAQDITNEANAGWRWTTHKSDCNTDRTGVGVAIDWHDDPAYPGNHVTTLTAPIGSIDVGVAAPGGALNATDNVVHPTPKSVAAHPDAVDISDPSQYTQWRGGCGVYSFHSGLNKSYNTGTWGRPPTQAEIDALKANPSAATGTSPVPLLKHRYPATFTGTVVICPLLYDVHGTTGGAPSKASEVTAGGSSHNGDNGAEKNGATPLGNTCVPKVLEAPSIDLLKGVRIKPPLEAYPPSDSTVADSEFLTTVDTHVDDHLQYRFRVTNNGDVSLTNVQVSEFVDEANGYSDRCDLQTPLFGPYKSVGDTDSELEPNESWDWVCEHVVTDSDVDHNSDAPTVLKNKARASAESTLSGDTVGPVFSEAQAVIYTDSLELQKRVARELDEVDDDGDWFDSVFASVGDTVYYRFRLTNSGNSALSNVTLNDPTTSGTTDPHTAAAVCTGDVSYYDSAGQAIEWDHTLASGQTIYIVCAHDLAPGDFAGDSLINIANADGTDGAGADVTSNDSQARVDLVSSALTIVKQVRRDDEQDWHDSVFAAVGETVHYRFTITNSGTSNATLTGVVLNELTGACAEGSLSPANSGYTLEAGESVEFTCDHTMTPDDFGEGHSYVNTATASGTDLAGHNVDSPPDTAEVKELETALAITKQVRRDDEETWHASVSAAVGETVHYRFEHRHLERDADRGRPERADRRLRRGLAVAGEHGLHARGRRVEGLHV
jgi:uncharacterized repeat protein (TIGR01451 family)